MEGRPGTTLRWPIDSPHKGPVILKVLSYDNIIIKRLTCYAVPYHGGQFRWQADSLSFLQALCQLLWLIGLNLISLCFLDDIVATAAFLQIINTTSSDDIYAADISLTSISWALLTDPRNLLESVSYPKFLALIFWILPSLEQSFCHSMHKVLTFHFQFIEESAGTFCEFEFLFLNFWWNKPWVIVWMTCLIMTCQIMMC